MRLSNEKLHSQQAIVCRVTIASSVELDMFHNLLAEVVFAVAAYSPPPGRDDVTK